MKKKIDKKNDKKTNKKNTPNAKLDNLGANVVTTPDYTMHKHGWSAVKARHTTFPVVIAAIIDLVLAIWSLFEPIANLINQLVTLIMEEHFQDIEGWHVAIAITLLLIIYVACSWNKQKKLCQATRKSTFTEFYRVKGGEGIVVHTDSEGRKMFPLHGVTRVEKIHPTIGKLEVFLGILKADYQPLLKRWLASKNGKLKDEGKTINPVELAEKAAKNAVKKATDKVKEKEKKNNPTPEYCDLKVTFVGGGEKVFYDVEDPDAFIKYIDNDTYSPTSSVVYKVSKKI